VDCTDLQGLLRAGRPIEGEAARHLATCPACAAMVGAAPRLPPPGAALAHELDRTLLAATMAEIDRDRGLGAWLRARSSSVRLALALLFAVSAPLAVALVFPRGDLPAYPPLRLALELGVLGLVALAATAVTLRPLHRAFPPALGVGVLAAVVCTAAGLASLPHAHVHAITAPDATTFLRGASACLLFGTLCAIPTWVALRLLAREGTALGRRATVLAAAATMVGVTGVFLHCPNVHGVHLWAGHVTVLVPWMLWAWWNARLPARA